MKILQRLWPVFFLFLSGCFFEGRQGIESPDLELAKVFGDPICLPACKAVLCPPPTPIPSPTPAPTPGPTPIPPPSLTTNVGQDYLGIKSIYWNVGAMLKALSEITAAIPTGSLLDTSFGYSDANIIALFNSGKTDRHRTHLLNTTCVNNSNCGNSDMLRGYSQSKLESEAHVNSSPLNQMLCAQARKVKVWETQYPGIQFYISPLLEHHLSQSAMINIFAQLNVCIAPTTIAFIDSHIQFYSDIPGTQKEQHGKDAQAASTSLDGNSVEDQDVQAYEDRNIGNPLNFIWARSYNCRLAKGDFIPPNARRTCPTLDQFTWFLRLMNHAEAPPITHPAWCANPQILSDPFLYKTSAEDYGTIGDLRANRPIYITTTHQAQINLFGKNGTQVGWMKFYGSYGASNSGLWRYYLGTGSGDSALTLNDKAKRISGSTWVFTQEGGMCKMINSLYRSSSFHD